MVHLNYIKLHSAFDVNVMTLTSLSRKKDVRNEVTVKEIKENITTICSKQELQF